MIKYDNKMCSVCDKWDDDYGCQDECFLEAGCTYDIMRVYLSGSITSDPQYKVMFYVAHEHFKNLGHDVFDPSLLPQGWTYQEYLKRCIEELTHCDYIYYVNDVTTSKGAFLEKIIADAVGIKEIK